VGVIDSQWWSLWGWPWMVVWLLTAACFAVLLRYTVVRFGWLRRRRRRGGRTVLGMCIFLHEAWVKSIAGIGGITNADKVQVAERTNVSSGFGAFGKLSFGGGKAQWDETRERVGTYLQENTPMKVIRLIMDRMAEEDVVVHADLTTGRLVPNRALSDTLRDGDRERVPLTAVMSDFVSVTGLFTAVRSDNRDIVLRAGYGGASPDAQVKISCEARWVREEFRVEDYEDGEFQARCLGKVRTWNPQTGELTLDPIAIFR